MEDSLKRWKYALERRRMKEEVTVSMFANERETGGSVKMQGVEVLQVDEFKYLGLQRLK